MIYFNWDLCRLPPFQHQKDGVELLTQSPMLLLADEMGAGKTKQCIDAAQFMFKNQDITRVIVVCPNAIRDVWFDPELGELKKHLWDSVPSLVTNYHAKKRQWEWGIVDPQYPDHKLRWIITNYEFIRSKERLAVLLSLTSKSTLLILDESSAVKNWTAQQTKACAALRARCGYIWQLNGTPIAHSPLDLYSQARLMDKKILDCDSFFHFRSRYAVITTRGGFPKITGWQRLDDLQARMKPFVLRRLKKDCMDLPEKLPPVTLSARLNAEEWHAYRELRDQLVLELSNDQVVTAPHAMVKRIRLAQICSGYIGGVEDAINEVLDEEGQPRDLFAAMEPPEWIKQDRQQVKKIVEERKLKIIDGVAILGTSKLDAFTDWLTFALESDPTLKLIVWCNFRPEVRMVIDAVREKFKHVETAMIWGGQKPEDRSKALRFLDPRTAPKTMPVVVAGTSATGSMGLTLTASHTTFYFSNHDSLKVRLQSEDRNHRAGQNEMVSYYDLVAVGPDGQKTVDHAKVKSLQERRDVAEWTTAAWVTALKEE